MLLNSLNFIFAFLPVVLILFYVVPGKWKNLVLALVSIFFYAWGEPVYVVLMLFSAVMHYMLAIDIGRKQKRSRSAVPSLVFVIVMDVFILGFFKYYGFLSGTVNEWLGTGFSTSALTLPIGLSFYTFKNLSYVIDVYKKKCQPERDPIAFMAYASLFACMSAGPIVRYADIKEDLYAHNVYMSRLGEGARRFILGLAKKVLLADQLSMMITQIQDSGSSMSMVTAWIYLFAYTMQIFFDFSGYSDMAIGVGNMLGFEFKENFDYPYIAKSVTEFWRRWHMSLSGWFRDYVYIPLGGNRVSVLCHLRNIVIVWCLTGIWHGATWNFPVWGLYYAVILIGEKYVWKNLLAKLPGWAANTYTMLLVMFGWLIFMNTSWDAAAGMFAALLGFGASSLIDVTAGYYLKTGILLFVLCVLAARPVLKKISERFVERYTIVTVLVYLVMFLLSIGGLVFNSYQPFLYMQF